MSNKFQTLNCPLNHFKPYDRDHCVALKYTIWDKVNTCYLQCPLPIVYLNVHFLCAYCVNIFECFVSCPFHLYFFCCCCCCCTLLEFTRARASYSVVSFFRCRMPIYNEWRSDNKSLVPSLCGMLFSQSIIKIHTSNDLNNRKKSSEKSRQLKCK